MYFTLFFFSLPPPLFFFSSYRQSSCSCSIFSFLHPVTVKCFSYSASHPSQRSRPRTHSSAVSSDPCQAFPSSLPEFPDMGRQSSRMKEGQHFTHPKLLQTTFPIKVWFSWRMKGCFRKHCKDLSPFEIFFSLQFSLWPILQTGCKTFSCYNVQKDSGEVIICFTKVKSAVDRWMVSLAEAYN